MPQKSTLVEESFQLYAQSCYPNCTANQKLALRQAFYAGAILICSSVKEASVLANTDELKATEILEAIMQEVLEASEELSKYENPGETPNHSSN